MSKFFLLCIFLPITLHAMQSPLEQCPNEVIENIIYKLACSETSNINDGKQLDSNGKSLYRNKAFFNDEYSLFDTKPIKKSTFKQITKNIKKIFSKNAHKSQKEYTESHITINGKSFAKNRLNLIFGTSDVDVPQEFRSPYGIKQIVHIKNFGRVNKRMHGIVQTLLYGNQSQLFLRPVITHIAQVMADIECSKTIENNLEMLQVYVAAHVDETKDCQHIKYFWDILKKAIDQESDTQQKEEAHLSTTIVDALDTLLLNDALKRRIFQRGRYLSVSSWYLCFFSPDKKKEAISSLK